MKCIGLVLCYNPKSQSPKLIPLLVKEGEKVGANRNYFYSQEDKVCLVSKLCRKLG